MMSDLVRILDDANVIWSICLGRQCNAEINSTGSEVRGLGLNLRSHLITKATGSFVKLAASEAWLKNQVR